jgi:hypothetical protein
MLADQLVTDLVAHFTATPPAPLAIVDFRTQADRPLPCVIIGHDGYEPEKSKGMIGTGRVSLRLAIVTDLDVTPVAYHRVAVTAIGDAVISLTPGELPLTYLHAIYVESPAAEIEDRRQTTVLAFSVVATRCRS